MLVVELSWGLHIFFHILAIQNAVNFGARDSQACSTSFPSLVAEDVEWPSIPCVLIGI